VVFSGLLGEQTMDLILSGKRVIVTGGTRGLGRAISEAFARGGAAVAMNYASNTQSAQEALNDICEKYPALTISLIKADITDEEQVRTLFDEAEKKLGGPIDILINNAGICPVCMILDTTYEVWKNVMDININAIFLTSKEFTRRRVEAGGGGRITNIVSQAAFNGSSRGKTHYSTTKGAAVSFTLSFAKEVAKYGIYVNAIAPGMMLTDLTRETLKQEGEVERYNKSIPVGRLAEVDEIADAVLFLSSEVASYTTGSTFDASGGIMSR